MGVWRYCYWVYLLSYGLSAPHSPLKISPTIDYQRYSRQILVYGEESQDIFNNSTVLLRGPHSPLMIEIVKNLALSGVGKILFVNATMSPSLLSHFVTSLNSETMVDFVSNLSIEAFSAPPLLPSVVVSVDESPEALLDLAAFCDTSLVPCVACAAHRHSGYVSSNLSEALARNRSPPTSPQRSFFGRLIPQWLTAGSPTRTPTRRERAVSPVTTSVIGSVSASEALKLLLAEGQQRKGTPPPLSLHRGRQASSWFAWSGDEFSQSQQPELHSKALSELSPSLSLLSHHPASSSQLHYPTRTSLPHNILTELRNMTILLVGSGAIGCEVLKLFSQLMREGDSAGLGQIIVADPDSIESSNLNRQVLFRERDIGLNKAIQAAENLKSDLNPHLRVVPLPVAVDQSRQSRSSLNDSLWQDVDLVITALDSVEARVFVDGLCVRYGKPLIDTGTMGLNGHVQVVLPHLTESYSSTTDPSTPQIPICSIRSRPTKPEHFVTWAKDLFQTYFHTNPLRVQRLLLSSTPSPLVEEYLALSSRASAQNWAETLLQRSFAQEDKGDRNGPPPPLDPKLMEQFASSAAEIIFRIMNPPPPLSFLQSPIPSFDKDDLSPYGHVNFLTAATNLRCQQFNSTILSSLTIRQIAGDIIPAVPTSTTLVAALALQETLKLAQDRILSRPNPSKEQLWRRIFPVSLLRRGHQEKSEESEKQRLLQRFRNSFFTLHQPEILRVRLVPAPELTVAKDLSLHTAPTDPLRSALTQWNYFTISDETGRELSAEEIAVDDIISLLQNLFNASLASLLWGDRVLFDSALHPSGSSLSIEQSVQLAMMMEEEGEGKRDEGEEEIRVVMEAVRGEERFLVPAPVRILRHRAVNL